MGAAITHDATDQAEITGLRIGLDGGAEMEDPDPWKLLHESDGDRTEYRMMDRDGAIVRNMVRDPDGQWHVTLTFAPNIHEVCFHIWQAGREIAEAKPDPA